MDIEKVRSRFIKHFDGKTGNIYMSPGRINLIGEHTDYNGGFVFPGAVDKGIMAEIRPNGTETVMLYSIDLKDRVEFKVNDPEGPRASWARYIYGICQEMKALGVDVKGFNAAFYGDVPLGAGMSSSAALESCFAFALNDLFGDNKVSKWDLVLAGQATEHKYVGVNCGIMDQFASVFGKEGKLMRLDCNSREFEYFPFEPKGYKLCLVNSKVKHELAGSPYNDRRNSCENVVKHIAAKHPEAKFETLRDCTWEQLEEVRAEVGEEDYSRAHFVLGEKDRVLAVCDALEKGDYETVGQKMYETEEATAAPASAELGEPYVSEYHLNSNFDKTTYLNDEDVMPTTGADNGLTLADMRDADYDDPRWEKLLDQLTVDEMANMIAMAGYQTAAMDSVGKVATLDFDGPAAINNNFTGVGSIGFPIEVVVASTWNKELAQAWGECMGKISQEMGAEGWYAPGMNTHRTAFGARNYEYFSEDGVLAGNMGAKAVEGARKYGVYSYIKHFALYEGNAKMVSVWSNEQAIREIYLKPFEISVKQGGANAVMVSWSFLGDKWTGECSNLINTVLREEWGFRGMALTDFFRNNGHGFMNADAALANGVDAMLSTFNGEENNVANPEHPTSVLQMRNACKNVMYTVVSSWAYDGEHEETGMENWKKAGIGIYIVIALFMAGMEVLVIRGYKKRKSAE